MQNFDSGFSVSLLNDKEDVSIWYRFPKTLTFSELSMYNAAIDKLKQVILDELGNIEADLLAEVED